MQMVRAVALAAVALVLIAPASVRAQTPPSLTVSKTQALNPTGETVVVRGSGYDETRGIYVAFCVVPPPGQTPTPCGGGADLSGEAGASRWISSNPPDYGVGLAEPFGPGGNFEVTITVNAQLNEQVDCRQVQCAVVTRSDHTRMSDRSLDVIVPIFFDTPATTTVLAAPAPTPVPTSTAAPTPTPSAALPANTEPVAASVPGDAGPGATAVPSAVPTSVPTIATITTTAPNAAPGDATTTIVSATVMPEPRGSASMWPVWVGSAGVAAGLVALAPRRGRQRS